MALNEPCKGPQAGYSKEHEEATEAIVTGFVEQITAGVAEARQLTQKQVCPPGGVAKKGPRT
jgi:DNA mismatch repair protein MutH